MLEPGRCSAASRATAWWAPRSEPARTAGSGQAGTRPTANNKVMAESVESEECQCQCQYCEK